MALRSTSGKFGLPSFGRRRGSDSQPQSRIASGATAPPAAAGGDSEDAQALASPTATTFSPSHNHTNSSSGGHLDGLGKKLGKKVAHTSLLPALGNQDLRTLQDIISSEKDVLKASDKLAQETASAAAKLAPYGQSEGPDLQDILTHSATLLTQLSDAYRTYAGHEASLRVCFKRIREREEKLDQMRRSRRTMTSKAETAERKLSKMGAENKQLLQQTELLERLRAEMRQIDADIVVEESKLGDFKRQMVKEAMSYKFGGLEELGEKMCIVGELGKLLLEEIPLEETPPGYSRAPYEGYTQTDKTTKEALRCLAQVQFHAASAAPKPPGLPGINNSPLQQASLGNGPVPEQSIAQREEFGDYIPGTESPPQHASNTPPRIPAIAGLDDRRDGEDEFGATHPPTDTGVVWQGPPEDTLEHEHGYEYEQQRAMDAAAEPTTHAPGGHERTPSFGAPIAERFATTNLSDSTEPDLPADPKVSQGWEPLRVPNRDSTGASIHSGPRYSLHDGPGYTLPAEEPAAAVHDQNRSFDALQTHTESFLAAPAQEHRPVTADGYYTPDDESVVAIPHAGAGAGIGGAGAAGVAAGGLHSAPGSAPVSPPRNHATSELAYDEPVVTIPDVAPTSPVRQLPRVPVPHHELDDEPVVVIHEKGYRPPASPPRVASPEDPVHSTLDSYYTSAPEKPSAGDSHYTERPRVPAADSYTGSAERPQDSYPGTPGSERPYVPASSEKPYVPASNGVMSAAAFRRGAKGRPSFNEDDEKPNMPTVPIGYQGGMLTGPGTGAGTGTQGVAAGSGAGTGQGVAQGAGEIQVPASPPPAYRDEARGGHF